MQWTQDLAIRLLFHRSTLHLELSHHALLSVTGRQFMLPMHRQEQPQPSVLVLFVQALCPKSGPHFLAKSLVTQGIFVEFRLLFPPPAILPACLLCFCLLQVEKQVRCASLQAQEFLTTLTHFLTAVVLGLSQLPQQHLLEQPLQPDDHFLC